MMKHLLPLLLLLVAVACADDSRFTVKGTMEGAPTTNLRFAYYNGNAFVQGLTAVRDGEFTFGGVTREPAVIELFDNEYRPLGRLYAANGDEITCHVDPANPYRLTASGNLELQRWTRWLNDHAAPLLLQSVADSLVETYVAAHPADVVSTLLVVTMADASTPGGLHRADSLLSLIEPAARPMAITGSFNALIEATLQGPDARLHDIVAHIFNHGRDTLRIADAPLWLITVSTDGPDRRDSLLPLLREAAAGKKAPAVLDISLDPDTTAGRRSVRRDSATW
ncbi:MAG: DUF4369 domain-containing protein, partial [Muribaculaceae bacterium]|nr:DUF4369 domain-containing protein [Muribaculaceae bacterium]